MEKLKYDSLYKFIVSIGIIVIIAPFICLFGLLNNNEVVFISQNDINQLTETAQEIITLEQNYKYLLLSKPIVIFITIIIVSVIGIGIVIYGIIQWHNKVQKYEDKSRELSNELLERRLQTLTPEEKENKIKEEVKQIETTEQTKELTNTLKEGQIDTYREIEEKVYKAIKRHFKNYKIFQEVRIEEQIYDCIALHTSNYLLNDYIFEIKYFANIKAIKNRIEALKQTMIKQKLCYYNNTNRYAKTVLVIIVKNFNEKVKLENKKMLDEINKQSTYIDRIIISGIEEIDKELKKIDKF